MENFKNRLLRARRHQWLIEYCEWLKSGNSSGLHKSLQFDLACDHFHNVFNILAVLLFLQFFRFFQHEFVET
jgi:hypothetical protein